MLTFELRKKMKATDINTSLIDYYFSLLKSLNANSKLELISRLSKSIKTTKTSKDESWKSLFGALKLDQSADEFVQNIQKDRNFTRKAIDL